MDNDVLIHIAIVEHKLIRHAIGKMIESFGFNVCIESDTGKDLIEKLERSTCLPDICVIDINMPEMNAYELVKDIRTRWSSIKILILSIYNSESGIVKLLQMGANGSILKDCDPAEFQKALSEIYHKGFYHPHFFSGKNLHSLLNKSHFPTALSAPELQFLSLCTTELTYKEMAQSMNIAPRTIETHRNNLFDKLNVKSRVGLAIFALKMGLEPH